MLLLPIGPLRTDAASLTFSIQPRDVVYEGIEPGRATPLLYLPFDPRLGTLKAVRFQIGFTGGVSYLIPGPASYGGFVEVRTQLRDGRGLVLESLGAPLEEIGGTVPGRVRRFSGNSRFLLYTPSAIEAFLAADVLELSAEVVMQQSTGPSFEDLVFSFRLSAVEDNGTFEFEPVPEPSSLLCVAFGLALLGLRQRSRN